MPHALSPGSSPPVTTEDAVMAEVPAASASAIDTVETKPQSVELPTASKLEDIFSDDMNDDEFSSSAPIKQDSSQVQPTVSTISASDPDTLLTFYQRLFPFRPLFSWLSGSHTPTTAFTNREFAFVLPSDAYIRYQSFPNADALRKQCLQMTPVRFEIGPEYTLNPRDRKSVRKPGAFRPVSKDLVFDVDLTDYDEIRTCCKKTAICRKCWVFAVLAIKVIDRALREDFGFRHLLWVYSGRRGVHCWVSDRRARVMDDTTRRSVANYLEVLRGSKSSSSSSSRPALRRPLHPHIERSLKILDAHFQTHILDTQDPWSHPDGAARLLSLIPDPTLTAALQKKWDSSPGRHSASKWGDIDALAAAGNLSRLRADQLRDVKQDIRLEYTYPRLDADVSKKLNHLLKSPFVVHPGTGRVCVPIDPAKVDDFDPFDVPTVAELLAEIDAWRAPVGAGQEGEEEEEAAGKTQDWQKTRLKGYVEHFKRFVDGLVKEENGEKKRVREIQGDGMEF